MNEFGGDLLVAYPAERDLKIWESRHAHGEVPGRWPYGLDELQRVVPGARAVALDEPSALRKLLARSLPRAWWVQETGTVITWDENAAARAEVQHRYAARVSGVIWGTDSATTGSGSSARRDRLVRTLSRCRGLWVLSSAQIEPLKALLGAGAPPIAFVRFGVDERFFSQTAYPAAPMVLSVGGDRDRDTATLFAALRRVHHARPEARLVVQTRSKLEPPEGVEVVRHLPHAALAELYRAAGVVTVATRENLHVSGMTVSLEAMATGRPVVITETPGMSDYVSHAATGLLSPVGDATALADHTLELLNDPGRSAAMGAAASAVVRESMTTRHLAARIAAVAKGMPDSVD